MAELVDAMDLKSIEQRCSCEFESHWWYDEKEAKKEKG